ncbi:MAG: aldo/keto reductase [Balneolaceae bacterium]|nr:aldo/keto reductase [Balneolaceae bacterium]MBO6544838.1 aldo/keto reductase [Balneolaceae bacterium]MBO6646234.1 aldo/keto reductase [Balneolaceae bacterium]
MITTPQYEQIPYRKCGNSGLYLPILSLGLWHNFGGLQTPEKVDEMLSWAFERGITHFDLANNYGPPPGSAEEQFGRALKTVFQGRRDELIISSKAGFGMWPGPYGDGGSRKFLIASCNQSLKRMGLEYVDIFYHHRPDPDTPLEESMRALEQIIRSGKALYAGISNYPAELAKEAIQMLKSWGVPVVIHQPKYNMFVREPEEGLFDVLEEEGIGSIPFSPLAQGLLTNKYIHGIPDGSRLADPQGFLQPEDLTENRLEQIKRLNTLAESRGQSLAQLALVWVLRQKAVTTALIGISSVKQLEDNLEALDNLELTEEELSEIESILSE